jgi:hypothetical protein
MGAFSGHVFARPGCTPFLSIHDPYIGRWRTIQGFHRHIDAHAHFECGAGQRLQQLEDVLRQIMVQRLSLRRDDDFSVNELIPIAPWRPKAKVLLDGNARRFDDRAHRASVVPLWARCDSAALIPGFAQQVAAVKQMMPVGSEHF